MRGAPLADLVALALVAAWLGAACLVAAAVAPAAFAVLPTRSLAGTLVGRVLPVVFWSGMGVGLAVAALSASAHGSRGRIVSGAIMTLCCAAAQLAVAPRIAAIRVAAGGALDALDPSDPRRQAFGRLHGISVAWMGAAGLAALVALVLLLRASSRNVS